MARRSRHEHLAELFKRATNIILRQWLLKGYRAAMTKPAKLYEQLLANPRTIISFRDFERLLKGFGWQHKRSRGSHRTYAHPSVPAVLTINPDGNAAHRYQVPLLLEFVEQYGLHMGS